MAKALQRFKPTYFQIFFSSLLSTHSLDLISELTASSNLKLQEIHTVFMVKLNLIAKEIDRRNNELERQEKILYPYLSPVQIAASIDT